MTNETGCVFPYERRFAEALREIEACREIEVHEARLGDVSPPLDQAPLVFEELAQDYGLSLGQQIQDRFFRFNEVQTYWRSTRSESRLVGEIHLTHIYRTVVENGLHVIWKGKDDEERELHQELKFFDDTPQTGSGRMALLRLPRGTTDPEVWYFDRYAGAMPMDIDYATYLDTLLITKGTAGWQYLYCATGFGDPGFTSALARLKEMAEEFPRLFPGHDYSDLRARLEARA
ncbi:hypothetical protein ACWGI9_14930 [Streptomyces sp. NPDC054833]